MNIFKRIADKYQYQAKKRPFITNTMTGFAIAFVGDIFCQKYLEKESNKNLLLPQWDIGRSIEMGCIRAAVITPFIHFWFPVLEKICPGSSFIRVFGRVALDSLIGSPIVISMVFASRAAFQGKLDTLPHRLEHQIRHFVKYWPIVHSINFSMVPLMHRQLVAHFASLYWMAVLSYYSNISEETESIDIVLSDSTDEKETVVDKAQTIKLETDTQMATSVATTTTTAATVATTAINALQD